MPKRYAVYVAGKNPAQRLGTVTASDRLTAIAKATELYGIPDAQLEVVLVKPRKLKRNKVRDGM